MNSLFKRVKNITQKKLSGSGTRNSFPGEKKEQAVFSLNNSKIPSLKQFKYIGKYLNKKELYLIRLSFLLIFLAAFYMANNFYKSHLELLPVRGGVYVEALIGFPSHVNPLYSSISDVDSDISQLIYSSLFKKDKDGKLQKDLVERYSVSEDGKTYTFKLRENARWHTGEKLTADDVVYTFESIKNKNNKSPLQNRFAETGIEKVNDYELKFLLSEKYFSFINLLTFGILPKNIWEQIPAEAMLLAEPNLKPVGSGPYKFVKFAKDHNGVIKEYYLGVNDDYYDKEPFVDLVFKFYSSFSEAIVALNSEEVDGVSYLPKELYQDIATPKKFNNYSLDLPEVSTLYINQESNAFLSSKEVRQALAYAINKTEIIDEVLFGEASLVEYPFLPSSYAYDNSILKYNYDLEKAQQLLSEAKWELLEIKEEDLNAEGEEGATTTELFKSMGVGTWLKKDDDFLRIKLAIAETDLEEKVSKKIVNFWESLGVKVDLVSYNENNIDDIFITRGFDVLLFSYLFEDDSDPFIYWHSSQIEGGLNFSSFNDGEVDDLLLAARESLDENTRKEKYKKFQEIVMDESPVIYLFSKKYNYLQTKRIKGFSEQQIYSPSERLLSISEWYLETGKKLIW